MTERRSPATVISGRSASTRPWMWSRGIGIRNPDEVFGSSLSYTADRLLRAGARVFLFDSRTGADSGDALVQAALAKGFGVPFIVLDDVDLAIGVGASAVVLETAPESVDRAVNQFGMAVGRHVAATTSIEDARDGQPELLVLEGPPSASDPTAWASFCRKAHELRNGCGLPMMVYGEFTIDEVKSLAGSGVDWIVVGSTFFSSDRPTGLLREFALAGPSGSVEVGGRHSLRGD